jgi:hypothetical protein
VGITTEAPTRESQHDAVDPRGWPNEELGPVKSYTFTMRTAVSFDAGDEVIMSIAGHVSRAMRSCYSHVRMEAKRRALDEIATRQRVADEKRPAQAGRGLRLYST